MSIPKRDPTYTEEDLLRDGCAFLRAGIKFWEGRAKFGEGGATAWFQDSELGMAIFTRGEYTDQLVNNIEAQDPVFIFGVIKR